MRKRRPPKKVSIPYLLLHNKLPPNLTVYNYNKHVLSHTFLWVRNVRAGILKLGDSSLEHLLRFQPRSTRAVVILKLGLSWRI